MADIRITPALSIMAFTSSLGFKETFTQEVSGSITLYGSGSTGRTDIFSVDGNNGRLFSVSDDLSNSLFSVNTIAGLPVIEAFADNTVNIGKYGAYSFQALGNGNAGIGSGSVMFVSASGNVGIGTLVPGYKLDVVGDIRLQGNNQIYFDTTGASASNYIGITNDYWLTLFSDRGNSARIDLTNGTGILFSESGAERMRVNAGGNVGIGTTNPGAKLAVYSTGDVPYILMNTAATANKRVRLQFTQGGNSGMELATDYNENNGNNFYLYDRVNSTTLGFFSAATTWFSGNVGIGTTNPSTKLSLEGAADLLRLTHDSAYISFYNTDNSSRTGYIQFNAGANLGIIGENITSLSLGVGSTVRLYINSSGNVGIGTTNPGPRLDVIGGGNNLSGTAYGSFRAIQDSTNYRGVALGYDTSGQIGIIYPETPGAASSLAFWTYTGAAWGERMRLTSAGNLGIGNTAPSYKLMVDGNVNATSVAAISNTATSGHQVYMGYNDGTNRGGITVEGGGGNSSSYGLQIGTYFKVRDDGRVGIGTTNPSSTLQVVGNVVATSFTGSLLGNVDGTATTATTATNATNVAVTANATNVSRYLTFVANSSGNNGTLVDTDLLYNPSLNLLSINNMWVWKGSNNTALSDNVMIGSGSGANLGAWSAGTSADRNVAMGYFAGGGITTGRANMLFGAFAGLNITTGNFNVMIGQQAGQQSVGTGNIGIGSLSLFSIGGTTAEYNTAIGFRAMQSSGTVINNTANNNVAIGRDAGFSMTTGTYNTIIGTFAGDLLTTGGGNTLIGSGSGESITTGNRNTLIGKYAGTSTLTTTVALSDGLGNIQFWATGSRVSLSGSLAVGAVGVSSTVGRIDASNDIVAYSTSDIHLKENIQPIQDALHKVSLISGNTFDWKSDPELTILHGFKGRDVGVIAQEIEFILPEVVTTRDSGYKAVKYEKLVPLLIEAIKELTDKVNKLENK